MGQSAQRVDAPAKARGEATYLDDIRFPDMLHGAVLRSKYPHALILNIETVKAKKLPGVKAVITGADVPYLHGEALVDEPFIARDIVRYMGDAVAAVAAVDEQTARDALELIKVEYKELPAVLDPLEAMKPGAFLIHPEMHSYIRRSVANPIKGTNICHYFHLSKGDIEKGFNESDYIFEDTFTTQMQQHCSLEPHAAICQVAFSGDITLWCNNDSPYRARRELAEAFKLPFNKIRVITPPYIGGNFGGKGGLKAEAIAAALALKVKGRPVKVVYSRKEEFTASLVRHPAVLTLKTGVKKDGVIVALKANIVMDTGAYTEKGPGVTTVAAKYAPGPYRIPNMNIEAYCVYTNKQVAGSCRGFGGCQPAWAHESQIDMIASKLGIDPVEVRVRNAYDEGDIHYSGHPLHSVSLKENLRETARLLEWNSKSPGRNRGRGLALLEKGSKIPSATGAFVKLEEDGTVGVMCSTTEVGQGADTVICQIVAEEMGVPFERVSRAAPDTAVTPFDTSTTSSRSTFHMGNAVLMAARDVKHQLLQMAARMFETNSEELDIENGTVFSRKNRDIAMSIEQILRKRYGSHASILGRGFYYHEDNTVPGIEPSMVNPYFVYFAQGAEVEVDLETGKVNIIKLVDVHDPGKAINPLNCYGQIEGGMVMGMGFATTEEILFDRGRTLNPSFSDYKIPRALDVPPMLPVLREKSCEKGPFGSKAMGESTTVGVAPAIANAIYDAVGVRIKDLPLRPEKIFQALKSKKASPRKRGSSSPLTGEV